MPVDFVVTNRKGDMFKAVEEIGASEVVVGFANKTHKNSNLRIAQLAYLMERGSPAANLPARPFFFPGLLNARQEIKSLSKYYGALAALGNRGAVTNGLDAIGRAAVNSIRRKLLSGPFAPLAPATVKAKGHDIPLIDTGEMLESITYRVRRSSKR